MSTNEQHEKKLAELRADKKSEIVTIAKLPNGSDLIVLKAKGKHMRVATKMAGGDTSKVTIAIAQQICYIDGAQKTMEDYDDLDLADYSQILIQVGKQMGNDQDGQA